MKSLALVLIGGVNLHLVVILIFLGFDFDLLLDDALFFGCGLLLSFDICISLQAILLLESDACVLIE